MCITYFAEDYDYYDYKPWFIDNKIYRGNNNVKDLHKEKYCVILGSAQTFGRRSNVVFSDLIAKECETKFINLSYGGNSPENILSNIRSSKVYREIILNADTILLQLMSPKNTRDDQGRYDWHPGSFMSFPEDKANKMFYTKFWHEYIKRNRSAGFLDLWYDIQLKYATEMNRIIKLFNKKTKTILLNIFKTRSGEFYHSQYIKNFPHVYPRVLDLLKSLVDCSIDFDIGRYPKERLYNTKNLNAKKNLKLIENNIHPNTLHIFNKLKKSHDKQPKITPNHSIYLTSEAHQDLAKDLYDYFT